MVWEAWVALVPAGGVHVVRMQLLERVGHVPTSEAAASAGGTAPVVTPTNAAAETIATQDSDDRWKKVRRLVETARSVDGVYPWQPEWDRMAIPKIAATVAAELETFMATTGGRAGGFFKESQRRETEGSA